MQSLAYAAYTNGIKIGARALLLYDELSALYTLSIKQGKPYTYIGQRALAERLQCSVRTIQNALNELKRAGLVTVKRVGQGCNNHMQVSPLRVLMRKSCASQIREKEIKKTNISINPQIERQTEKPIQAKAETMQTGKGRPTPARPAIDKERKVSARRAYREHLAKLAGVDLSVCKGLFARQTRFEQKIIEILTEVAQSDTPVRINGNTITPTEYMEALERLDRGALTAIIARLDYARRNYDIQNERAYLLAVAWNTLHLRL